MRLKTGALRSSNDRSASARAGGGLPTEMPHIEDFFFSNIISSTAVDESNSFHDSLVDLINNYRSDLSLELDSMRKAQQGITKQIADVDCLAQTTLGATQARVAHLQSDLYNLRHVNNLALAAQKTQESVASILESLQQIDAVLPPHERLCPQMSPHKKHYPRLHLALQKNNNNLYSTPDDHSRKSAGGRRRAKSNSSRAASTSSGKSRRSVGSIDGPKPSNKLTVESFHISSFSPDSSSWPATSTTRIQRQQSPELDDSFPLKVQTKVTAASSSSGPVSNDEFELTETFSPIQGTSQTDLPSTLNDSEVVVTLSPRTVSSTTRSQEIFSLSSTPASSSFALSSPSIKASSSSNTISKTLKDASAKDLEDILLSPDKHENDLKLSFSGPSPAEPALSLNQALGELQEPFKLSDLSPLDEPHDMPIVVTPEEFTSQRDSLDVLNKSDSRSVIETDEPSLSENEPATNGGSLISLEHFNESQPTESTSENWINGDIVFEENKEQQKQKDSQQTEAAFDHNSSVAPALENQTEPLEGERSENTANVICHSKPCDGLKEPSLDEQINFQKQTTSDESNKDLIPIEGPPLNQTPEIEPEPKRVPEPEPESEPEPELEPEPEPEPRSEPELEPELEPEFEPEPEPEPESKPEPKPENEAIFDKGQSLSEIKEPEDDIYHSFKHTSSFVDSSTLDSSEEKVENNLNSKTSLDNLNEEVSNTVTKTNGSALELKVSLNQESFTKESDTSLDSGAGELLVKDQDGELAPGKESPSNDETNHLLTDNQNPVPDLDVSSVVEAETNSVHQSEPQQNSTEETAIEVVMPSVKKNVECLISTEYQSSVKVDEPTTEITTHSTSDKDDNLLIHESAHIPAIKAFSIDDENTTEERHLPVAVSASSKEEAETTSTKPLNSLAISDESSLANNESNFTIKPMDPLATDEQSSSVDMGKKGDNDVPILPNVETEPSTASSTSHSSVKADSLSGAEEIDPETSFDVKAENTISNDTLTKSALLAKVPSNTTFTPEYSAETSANDMSSSLNSDETQIGGDDDNKYGDLELVSPLYMPAVKAAPAVAATVVVGGIECYSPVSGTFSVPSTSSVQVSQSHQDSLADTTMGASFSSTNAASEESSRSGSFVLTRHSSLRETFASLGVVADVGAPVTGTSSGSVAAKLAMLSSSKSSLSISAASSDQENASAARKYLGGLFAKK